MFHKEASSSGGGPTKKRSMDVPLKKSERRVLRKSAHAFFIHPKEKNDNYDDDNDLTTSTTKSDCETILDIAFLQGNVMQRKLTLPGTKTKVFLYTRNPTKEENHTPLLHWPFTTPQIIWISMEENRNEWIHIPSLALVALVLGCSTSQQEQQQEEDSYCACPATVIVPSAVSKFMCRGAHLMRAGMRQIIQNTNKRNREFDGIVVICVNGNPQPMAIGRLTPHTTTETIGPDTKGIGVNIITCYGDDIWRAQYMANTTSTTDTSATGGGSQPGNDNHDWINPLGGASYNNGHYGNVGFLEGKYVSPIVAVENEDSDNDAGDKDDDKTNEVSKEQNEASSLNQQQQQEEKESSETADTQKDNNHGDNDNNNDNDSDSSTQQNPYDVVLDDAFRRACVSVSKSDLPMTTANFYAQHVIKHATEPIQLKQTSYKKLSTYLRECVQSGIVTVKADKNDPMAYITSVNRGHIELRSYRQEAKNKDSSADGATNNKTKKKKMALVNLFRIPHHFISLMHLDMDDVKATNAKSPERQGTGMLTAPEARSILETYIASNDLVDTLYNPEDVKVDGPLCDALYKKMKPNYPTQVSRKDLATSWLDHMEPAYAIVEMPGSKIIHLAKGNPSKVSIEVSMRSGRKFITRIRGVEAYGIHADNLAKDIAKRFACSVSVETETSDGRPALKKGHSELVMQGNLAEELKALLLGDERLTTHGGAKDSDYCVPKNVISVTLKKGVPGKKKR